MTDMKKSFSAIHQFLSSQHDNVHSALAMATDGLSGLWFVANEQFISHTMNLCITVYVVCVCDL